MTSQQRQEAIAARAAVALAAAYELVALTTRKVPTISAWVWRLPLLARIGVWLILAVGFFDHFVTRRIT